MTEPEEETPEILAESDVLTAGEMLVEGASAIGRVEVPKTGKLFADDGSVQLSVIRPCVSRGRRLRGLPPIYTPQMLAENAAVFSGWLMYMDHLTERIVEMLQERGRSITELGGRIVRSWYDPELLFEDDAEYGFQKGGVRAIAIPQPPIRAMLEADPGLLHVSINAYPRSARAGTAPWDNTVKGMIVEGIRSRPVGSVDWVPRAGAGGRPLLQEWEDAAVTILESHYAAPRGRTDKMPEFKNMSLEQLTESLRADNPELAKQLGLAEGDARGGGGSSSGGASAPAGLTQADLDRALAERDATWEQKLAEKDETLEERATELITEREEAREEARVLERDAQRMIADAKLRPTWAEDLQRRWSVLPSGPSAALSRVMEMATAEKPAREILKEAVKADLNHAADLIAEAAGERKPRVRGLGGDGGAQNQAGERKAQPRNTAFRDFLRESGGFAKQGDKEVPLEEGIREMISEGVR